MRTSAITTLIMGAGLLLAIGAGAPAIHAETLLLPAPVKPTLMTFLGGTVEDIDHAGLRLTLQTEMGKKESLPVLNAEAIKGITKGDQVSVELDGQGKVLKAVKTDFAPKPAPEPRS